MKGVAHLMTDPSPWKTALALRRVQADAVGKYWITITHATKESGTWSIWFPVEAAERVVREGQPPSGIISVGAKLNSPDGDDRAYIIHSTDAQLFIDAMLGALNALKQARPNANTYVQLTRSYVTDPWKVLVRKIPTNPQP